MIICWYKYTYLLLASIALTTYSRQSCIHLYVPLTALLRYLRRVSGKFLCAGVCFFLWCTSDILNCTVDIIVQALPAFTEWSYLKLACGRHYIIAVTSNRQIPGLGHIVQTPKFQITRLTCKRHEVHGNQDSKGPKGKGREKRFLVSPKQGGGEKNSTAPKNKGRGKWFLIFHRPC